MNSVGKYHIFRCNVKKVMDVNFVNNELDNLKLQNLIHSYSITYTI